VGPTGLPWAALALALASACHPQIHGRTAAQGTGRLVEPAPRRGSPLEPFAECGSGELTRAGRRTVRRRPYVQNTHARGTHVAWTADSAEPVRLELTRPDGAVVREVSSRVEPGTPVPGVHRHVTHLDRLESATLYCYRLFRGDVALNDRTGVRTARRSGPVQFVVFGDSGFGGPDQRAVRRQLETVRYDLLLHTGDVAYPEGTRAQLERYFFQVYDPLLRVLPVYPVAGNHDYRTEHAAPFREAFILPGEPSRPGHERWYSFDWGDVHFVALDTQRIGADQVDWLKRDLAANRRPWIVVYMHHPAFSSGRHGGLANVKQTLVPLFRQFGVDVVFSGHEHHYERTRPIDGVTYIVTGGGGRGVRPIEPSSFTAYGEAVLHFVYGRVRRRTMTLYALDATGRVFDSVRLER
jgi:predicted phosphodiesterase